MDDRTALRFRRLAEGYGLLSKKHFIECLNQHEFGDPRPVTEILIEKGYLLPRHVEKLERILARPADEEAPRFSKERFGVLATRAGYASESQIEQYLVEQKRMARRDLVLPIGRILISRKVMTAEQVLEIMALQGRNFLRCVGCNRGFTITRFSEYEFYRCQRCQGELVPDIPRRVSRRKLDLHLEPIAFEPGSVEPEDLVDFDDDDDTDDPVPDLETFDL